MIPERRKSARRFLGMTVLSASLLVLLLVPAPTVASPQAIFSKDPHALGQVLEKAFGTDFLDVVRTKFPDDYNRLVARTLKAAAKSLAKGEKDYASARVEAARAGETMRHKNAHYAKTAPQSAAQAYLSAHARFIQAMSSSPKVCGKFAVEGYSSLSLKETRSLPKKLMEQTAVEMMNALAAGRDAPVPPQRVTQQGRDNVVRGWLAYPGVRREWAALIGNTKNGSDPEYCVALASYLHYVATSSSPSAERIARQLLAMLADG